MEKIKQIILIHPQKFVLKAFEAFGKKAGISVYSLEEPIDFSYLIDELKPELLIIHQNAFSDHSETYLEQVKCSQFKDFKQVLITKESYQLPEGFSAQLVEPLKIDELGKILSGLLAEHH